MSCALDAIRAAGDDGVLRVGQVARQHPGNFLAVARRRPRSIEGDHRIRLHTEQVDAASRPEPVRGPATQLLQLPRPLRINRRNEPICLDFGDDPGDGVDTHTVVCMFPPERRLHRSHARDVGTAVHQGDGLNGPDPGEQLARGCIVRGANDGEHHPGGMFLTGEISERRHQRGGSFTIGLRPIGAQRVPSAVSPSYAILALRMAWRSATRTRARSTSDTGP